MKNNNNNNNYLILIEAIRNNNKLQIVFNSEDEHRQALDTYNSLIKNEFQVVWRRLDGRRFKTKDDFYAQYNHKEN